MQLPLLLISALLGATHVVADVKTFTGPLTDTEDIAALKACVESMRANPTWNDGFECGYHHFQLGGSYWNSAADCMGGCAPFLLGAAGLGAEWAKCDQQTGSAHCWVGWSQDGCSMCGDEAPCC